MEKLRCVIERITYHNEDNGYTVIKVRVKNYNDLVTVVGNTASVNVGSVLMLEGSWKIDSKYGRQFAAEKWEELMPATVLGIEKYLGSGLIKGIGPQYAKRITQKFGKDTFEIIETDLDRLREIPGIGDKRIGMIKKGWEEQKEVKNIMLFLQGHDVSTTHAAKIYKAYGNNSITTVTENPYKLADDIWGIGFKTADTIAEKLGFEKDRYVRLRSGVIYTLNKLSEDGHCFATRQQLIDKAGELLEADTGFIEHTIDEMVVAQDLIKDDDAIYLPPFYFSEEGTAKRLKQVFSSPRIINGTESLIDSCCLDKKLEEIQKEKHIKYDDIQKEAIKCATSSKVMVLTGGPGTGKTTTMVGIINIYKSLGFRVILAAPTGRAAKRMSEVTGMEAKTLHRLLEYKPPEGYQKNEANPLNGDVLIVDECSMIDIILMYNLLKAVPNGMTLIMVGDTDQLPSVGAGNVLRDIIESQSVPVVRLQRIFRQAMNSKIITNAHKINKGMPIDMKSEAGSDFFFMEETEVEKAAQLIVDLCRKRLPKYYKIDPAKDIQVLTPMQRGEIGAVNLNRMLQEALNDSTIMLKRGGIEYRLKDKVMQIKNNYDKEVFNGDIGTITHVDLEDRSLQVDFEGTLAEYDISELDELQLAYATTVHKSQGSEYPVVVLPFMMTHFVMLQRNLLYTAITRAKKILVLIGEKRAVYYAIKNNSVVERNTRLAQRLSSAYPIGDGSQEFTL